MLYKEQNEDGRYKAKREYLEIKDGFEIEKQDTQIHIRKKVSFSI